MAKEKSELIEIRHLRYFIVLSEELHFSRAAERLRIEQSPLSRAIRETEHLLGVRLFERNTRGTRITRAGTVLREYACRVINLLEQAKTSTRSAALGQSDHLRIGVSDCTAYCRVMEILARYRTINPDVSVSLHEMPLHRQISAIRDNLLDASISLDGSYREGIEAQVLARDALCAIVPTGHPLARANVVLATDVVRHPLVLFAAESDLRAGSQIDNFVHSLGRAHIVFRASSLGTMLTLVALGHGIGLVGSAQMMGLRRTDVVVRLVGGTTSSLTTYALHSSCGRSEPLDVFIELARDLLANDDSTAELS